MDLSVAGPGWGRKAAGTPRAARGPASYLWARTPRNVAMSAVAETRKHPDAAAVATPAREPKASRGTSGNDHVWDAMMDVLATHMQDRADLYRRLAR